MKEKYTIKKYELNLEHVIYSIDFFGLTFETMPSNKLLNSVDIEDEEDDSIYNMDNCEINLLLHKDIKKEDNAKFYDIFFKKLKLLLEEGKINTYGSENQELILNILKKLINFKIFNFKCI